MLQEKYGLVLEAKPGFAFGSQFIMKPENEKFLNMQPICVYNLSTLTT